ncbi:tlde1 domain-containing protein [Mucilaginibacter jinjuensis]|uniref:DUF2778 domain-containing protein n=1 Tax=Mucilaginibacter jinjuensis TaxID=1176721 RepID=A0ABY7T7K3_9SPHI|nr:tlde1 domain-containing protein [Mucilaginibacter jinjuensis]WCT12234.1 DUF2778 domain-containing protein [Mucilaginibacter jinjuensis]
MENLTESETRTLAAILKTNAHSYGLDDHFQDNASIWLEYDGAFVYCYRGSYGQKGMVVAKYKASSGAPGYQRARYESTKDYGPLPEGKYWVLLMPNPARVAKHDSRTGELLANPEGGIEKIPGSVVVGGHTLIYPGWGNTRARLFADRGTQTFGRSNFYLHDSHKGYSHGCIETSPHIFDLLMKARQSFTKVALMVDYANVDTSTYGESDK